MRTITLKSTGVGRYDDVSPFLITDRELPLKIALPDFNGEFYLVYENVVERVKRIIPENGELTLKGLAAGEFRAEVKHYLKGEIIKTYKVEPLILKEADGSLAAEPEMAELRHLYAELKEELAAERVRTEGLYSALTEEHKRADGLTERLEATERTVAGLVKFAKDDYKNNVYLGGGSAEEFNEKYGFAESEPKGENENDE